MAEATFYTVSGPRGVYYALRNHATGKIWTERTELATNQQASDEGLVIVSTETISHSALLDLMIPRSSAAARSSTGPAGDVEPARPNLRVEKGLTRLLRRFRRQPGPVQHHE